MNKFTMLDANLFNKELMGEKPISKLQLYIDKMNSKEEFYQSFSSSEDNVLMHKDGDVTLRMALPKNITTGFGAYNPAFALKKGKIKVSVQSVDTKKKLVILHFREEEYIDNRNKLIEAIENSLKLNEYPIVYAKITGYTNYHRTERQYAGLRLNIGGYEIPGYLDRKQWSTAFTNDFRFCAEVGEVIKVAITTKDEEKKTYTCSRKLAMDDPWKKLPPIIKEGNCITAKCVYVNAEGVTDCRYFECPDVNIKCAVRNADVSLLGKDITMKIMKFNKAERILLARQE